MVHDTGELPRNGEIGANDCGQRATSALMKPCTRTKACRADRNDCDSQSCVPANLPMTMEQQRRGRKQHLFRRYETRFSQHKFNFNDFLAFVACQRCTMAVASMPAGLDELCTSFRDRETWLDEISDKKKNVGWGKVFTWFTICRVPCTFCLALCHFSLVLIVW